MGLRRTLVLLGALLLGCGDDPAAAGPDRAALHAEIAGAADAGDWNTVLSRARRALTLHGEHPRTLWWAARGALGLDRVNEALEYLDQADALPADGDLAAELAAVRGQAHLLRYAQLRQDADRVAASLNLERGAAAGALRASAAYGLVRLQDLAPEPNRAKQRKHAELFLRLEPDSARAEKLRADLRARGVLP